MTQGGGAVTWNKLVTGVEEAFGSDEFKAMIPARQSQTPVLATGELGYTHLVEVKRPTETAATPAAVPLVGKGKAELAEGGKARVKPSGGADLIYTESSRGGGENLGAPYLDKNTVVSVEEIVGTRCRVEWTHEKKTYGGWVNTKDLAPDR